MSKTITLTDDEVQIVLEALDHEREQENFEHNEVQAIIDKLV